MIQFTLIHPRATEQMLGYVPQFFSEADPRGAREQIAENYIGGWHPMQGFHMLNTGIRYGGDPVRPLVAEARLRYEIIRFYVGAWLAIIQPDGSHEIACVD